MIYAGDLAIQLPVRDIYDTLIMLASINAARDMYERGLKLIEDFYKNYGDFFSPISSDMDWYNQNVTGRARDFIQNLYNNGVDPLRSAEGRAAIQLFIYSMPVGDINKRKQSAAAAQEYIKARGKLEAEGLWNPEYEKYLLGGRTLENWDTNRDGYWNRTSPAQFKDLNAATYQWFDKLDKSYLRTEGGYDYFGVDENAMNKIMASQIPGFINSGIGGFHYEMARRLLQAEGNEDPTSQLVTDRLIRNIRSANSEVLSEDRKINPEYDKEMDWNYKKREMAVQHQYDMALLGLKNDGRSNSSSSGGGASSQQLNYMFNLFNMGISKALTGNAASFLQAPVDLTTIAGDAMKFGYNNRSGDFGTRRQAYLDKYQMSGGIGAGTFVAMLNGSGTRKRSDMSNTVYGTTGDIEKRLYSEESVIGNTIGFRTGAKMYGTDRSKLKEYGDNQILITPTEEVYTAPFKDGRIKLFVKVRVTGIKTIAVNGKPQEKQEDLGYYYYELQRGAKNSYTETTGSDGRKLKIWSDRWDSAWDDSELGRISEMNSGAHNYLHPETQKINKIYQ